MKRNRDNEALSTYLASQFVQSTRYNEATQRFNYQDERGVVREAGGLISLLRATYYPHYTEGAAPKGRNKWKAGKPSNQVQGIQVDADMQLLAAARGAYIPPNLHPMSMALLTHWQKKGHTVVAAQVPARIDLRL